MTIYIILFGILSSFGLFAINVSKKTNLRIYIILVIILILFAGLRGNGFDWRAYLQVFNGIHHGIVFSGVHFIEPGFSFLINISPSFRFFIIASATLSISLTLLYAYKLTKDTIPILGLAIFFTTLFLPTYMGQIRQGIAIGFIIMAYYHIIINKRIIAIILIICGSLFHISALTALLVFFIKKDDYSVWLYITLLLVALIISQLIAPQFSAQLRKFEYGITDKLAYYSQTEKVFLGLTPTIIVRIITFFTVLYQNKKQNNNIQFLNNIYFLGIFLYLLLGFLPQLAGRGTYYFSIMEMVLVPFIVKSLIKQTTLYLTSLIIVLSLSFYRLYSFFSISYNYDSYVPYILN